MREVVIVDAVRTPIGRAGRDQAYYKDIRADDLADAVRCKHEEADLLRALNGWCAKDRPFAHPVNWEDVVHEDDVER